jgi:hypothetical protein
MEMTDIIVEIEVLGEKCKVRRLPPFRLKKLLGNGVSKDMADIEVDSIVAGFVEPKYTHEEVMSIESEEKYYALQEAFTLVNKKGIAALGNSMVRSSTQSPEKSTTSSNST